MKPFFAISIACILTIGAAVLHGDYTRRWRSAESDFELAQSIAHLPDQIGDWESFAKGEPLAEYVCRELGLLDHLHRFYKNRKTGQVVQLLLMVGQPGPLVRHPPTICYANRAHKQLGPPGWIPVGAPDSASRFQLLRYEPSGALADERFYVAYGHTLDGQWDVPQFPRFTYGAADRLYKAQILTMQWAEGSEDAAIEGLSDFVNEFANAFKASGNLDFTHKLAFVKSA